MNVISNLSKRSPVEARHRQPKSTVFWARLWLLALTAFGGVALPTLITPPVAQAYTSRVNLFVVREQNESFETLVQRSEIIARAAIQRSFDADLLMTDVVVTVIGDNRGISVPILAVPVSRSEWQLRPDVTQWAQYFEASRNLVVDEVEGEADN
ncbi:hypothetical protein IQ254_15630 [Nodosilinea sp. LEGE 07088]|uniref:hypothetical protein n=1 Tax=Nodosilinea sp. LEGE 07088 TaxID=2777968 RepID=UPI0018807B4F|nr:hypothetical protein [Nodosilinea sp. LEGE 07088]MBE9138604.1 hypothetical protein [Nodosilinea sp. LEGE 07088]